MTLQIISLASQVAPVSDMAMIGEWVTCHHNCQISRTKAIRTGLEIRREKKKEIEAFVNISVVLWIYT